MLSLRRAAIGLLSILAPLACAQQAQKPWPVKAVIVTTFEIGKDEGDIPGEFQLWVEREHLTETLEFPGGIHPIRSNKDHTVLGIVSGTTLVNASTSLMALGLDPRFDLTQAYWLVNGIAGVDPSDAGIGSAAWANYVINDISRYIDPREMPKDWSTGYFAIGAHEPNKLPPAGGVINDRVNAYALNPGLTAWAYKLTKDTELLDDPKVAEFRKSFTGYPNAQKPPFVLIGDSFASDSYWHGKLMTDFANDWVKLFTDGQGNFVMTEMEDSAFAEALKRLEHMKKANFNRLMVLRTGSNFSMPRPGYTAIQSVNSPYIGTRPAVENAWRVGSKALHEITNNWDKYGPHVPGE
ncbi:purine nucleoside permease [Terriglobus tenax]|uniref:purine nucleoside permease n=1 Tax=Terriglobus tenax TaxID=1111115 RepID=UPI0021E09C80|nr:purine nucleoside permease [Terriglobus tenax]